MKKRNERTSARVARIAAKILAVKGGGNSLLCTAFADDIAFDIRWRDIRALAASALTQAPDRAPAVNFQRARTVKARGLKKARRK